MEFGVSAVSAVPPAAVTRGVRLRPSLGGRSPGAAKAHRYAAQEEAHCSPRPSCRCVSPAPAARALAACGCRHSENMPEEHPEHRGHRGMERHWVPGVPARVSSHFAIRSLPVATPAHANRVGHAADRAALPPDFDLGKTRAAPSCNVLGSPSRLRAPTQPSLRR